MGMVKLLFSFHGRISRSQYWLGGLVIFVVALVAIIGAVMQIGGQIANGGFNPSIIPLLLGCGVIYLGCVYCGAALNVKRLHDRGRTGFLALLAFVPAFLMINGLMSSGGDMAHMVGAGLMTNAVSTLINIYFLVDLGMMPSKPEPNQYGDPPRPGGYTAPPPVRPTGGAAPGFALNSAQDAMERAIAAQSSPRMAQPHLQTAPPVRAATAPQRAPVQPQPAPVTATGAPRAFGKRAPG